MLLYSSNNLDAKLQMVILIWFNKRYDGLSIPSCCELQWKPTNNYKCVEKWTGKSLWCFVILLGNVPTYTFLREFGKGIFHRR
jgi:hypothetical protein